MGNVLGPLVQMLSLSSVEYSRAASRARQDGCISERERATGKEISVEGATWVEEKAAEREHRRVFSVFRVHSSNIIKKSAG